MWSISARPDAAVGGGGVAVLASPFMVKIGGGGGGGGSGARGGGGGGRGRSRGSGSFAFSNLQLRRLEVAVLALIAWVLMAAGAYIRPLFSPTYAQCVSMKPCNTQDNTQKILKVSRRGGGV